MSIQPTIEKQLSNFECRTKVNPVELENRPVKHKASNKYTPLFNVKAHLMQMTGVDLTAIPGIEAYTGLKLISEMGLDMKRWKTGKQLSGKTKRTKNRAASALRMAASSLYRSNSALGAFFRRLKGRVGAPKATTANAHKLGILIYNMLKKGIKYSETGQDYYEQRYHERLVKGLSMRTKSLGYELVEMKVNLASEAEVTRARSSNIKNKRRDRQSA